MSDSRNTLLAAVFTLGTLAVVAQSTEACKGGRSSGGYSGGYAQSYFSHSYNSYSAPRYNSYSQPTYRPTYSQPVQIAQPVQSFTTVSAQPVIQQQAPAPQIVQPQPVAAPQPQIAPQPLQQTPTAQTNPTTTMSALQALGGFAPPQTAAPQPQQVQAPAYVGNWTATLGNGSTVKLTLLADGNFNWIATNSNGSSSSFAGNFTVANGSLSLNRSNDNQQLSGSMTTNGNDAFSFTVTGTNAASINFNRS